MSRGLPALHALACDRRDARIVPSPRACTALSVATPGASTTGTAGPATSSAVATGHVARIPRRLFSRLSAYVARNPVEAGIVSRPEDWRWSSFGTTVGVSDMFDFVDADDVLGAVRGDPNCSHSGAPALRRVRRASRPRRTRRVFRTRPRAWHRDVARRDLYRCGWPSPSGGGAPAAPAGRAPRRRAPAATRSASRARASSRRKFSSLSSRLFSLRELVADPVEPLEQHVEAPVREVVLHAAHRSVRELARANGRRRPRRRAPRAPRSSVPTVSTRRAAPTCASASSASSRGASVKTPIRAPAACSRRSSGARVGARAEVRAARGRRRSARAAAASRRAARRARPPPPSDPPARRARRARAAPRPRASRSRAAACPRARRRGRARARPSRRRC